MMAFYFPIYWTRLGKKCLCSEVLLIGIFLIGIMVRLTKVEDEVERQSVQERNAAWDNEAFSIQERNAPRDGTAFRIPQENSFKQMMGRSKGQMTATDPKTIWLLKSRYLHPPDDLPYNLKEDGGAKEKPYLEYKFTNPSWTFIHSVLGDLFSSQHPGFFVEAGALDGEYLSNTLWLERSLGWTGLLVEAEEESYRALRGKHRRAWSSPACLSATPFAHTSVLTAFRGHESNAKWWNRGAARIEKDPMAAADGPGYRTFQKVQCFPLVSFFIALNISTINFISLDVEGLEIGVLKNFPFNKITVDVWAIEHGKKEDTNKIPSGEDKITEDLETKLPSYEDPHFIDFMEQRGYYLFDMFCHHIPDYIFIRRGSELFRRLEVPVELWKRRGICLHKDEWRSEQKFDPRRHRDARHWPKLAYDPKKKV